MGAAKAADFKVRFSHNLIGLKNLGVHAEHRLVATEFEISVQW